MKILLLSHIYAPDRSPRAYRWAALAEHWAAQGRQVEVIAGWKPGDLRQEQRGGVIVHRVGGSLVERLRGGLLGQASHRAETADDGADAAYGQRRLARAAKAIYGASLRRLLWPDYAFHWYPAALRTAEARSRAVGFDAVISVSHPFTAHLVGMALKRRRPGLRWLADIGDPFSLLVETPLNNRALYGGLNRRAEAAVLREADGVAVTVERCRTAYAAAFPGSADKIATIPPLLSLPAPAAGAPWAFPAGVNLVCIGTLYRTLRDPGPLLALFAALRRRRADLNLHFFGAIHDCGPCFVPHEAEIGRSIHLHGMVPRETIANVMRAADILVNIGNATAHQLPSKLVEYVASARPILNLASATDDTTAAFLAHYPAALTLRTTDCQSDPDAISAALAFIAAPPPIDAGEARRFLEPYALAPIAAAYDRLLAMTGDCAKGQSGAMAVHGSVSPSPIRVLVNAVHARAGGGITYLRHLLPLLAAEPDLEIHVIPHPSQAQTFAAPGIRLHHHRLPASWAALLVWEQAVLPVLARRIGCDLLVSAANFGPLLARRQVIVMQAPLTVGALERRFRKKLYWATLRLMTRLSLSRARRAIAVSRHLAAGAPHRRPPIVIHYGLDPVFSPGPAPPSEPPFLLAVSDFYLHKNLHRLVEAFALVRREHPAITLRIAGAAIDADYAASIGERIAALGLTDAVLLLGSRRRAELLALYRSCAVFVFPSLEETFGLPLVEAMACGAPVVSAARSVMPEIAGGAALEVDPEDPSAIAEAILRILGNPELAVELRRRGLERAKAFSWEECARRTAAVLREAAGREAAPSAA